MTLYLDKNAEQLLQIQKDLEDALILEGESFSIKSYLRRRRRKVMSMIRRIEKMYRG